MKTKRIVGGLIFFLLLLGLVQSFATTISNISVSSTTASSATITWATSTAATSQVIYGLNGGTGSSTPTNQALSTSHSVTVSPLVAGQVYTYKVVSIDTSGSTISSANTFQLCSGSGPTAGYTNVTGTVGVPYAQGMLSASWVNDSGVSTSSPTICGAPFQATITSTLTTTGNLALQLPDNNSIVPSPGRWTLNITNATGNVGAFSITTAISGTSIGLTSQLQVASGGQLQLIYYDPATGQFDPPIVPSSVTNQALTVTPSINFGTVKTGTTVTQNAAITNTGTAYVTVSSVVPSGDPAITLPTPNICNIIYPPGGTCVLPVSFSPISGITSNTTLTVNSTVPASPINPTNLVAVVGTGTATTTFALTVNGGTSTGSGTISSNETVPIIVCGINPPASPIPPCSNNYQSGASVVLTAAPLPGSTFSGFGAGVCSTTTQFTCTVSISAATTVSANFTLTPVNVTLNLTGTGGGTGSVTSNVSSTNGILNCISTAGVIASGGNQGCSGPYPQGTSVILTELPVTNSTFVGWSGACDGSTATTCPVTLNSSTQTVTANFASTSLIPITLVQSATNCAVSGATIACNWGQAMAAGDAIVLGIGWPDSSSTVSSVTDTAGNSYASALGPTSGTALRQQIYYAQNITAAAAGANTTTATLSTSVSGTAGTALTTNTVGGGTTATTASATLTNNNLILVSFDAVLVSGNGPGAISSVVDTGCGLTWVKLNSINFGGVEGTGTSERLETWRTLGNGSSCTITATWGQSVSAKLWTVSKLSGVNTGGTNGSAAVGISATAGNNGIASPATVTMGTFGSASNGTYAVTAMGSQPASVSAGSGMTLLNQQSKMQDEFAVGNISPAQFTWSDGTTPSWGIIGIEIVAASAGRRDIRAAEYSGILQSGSPVDVTAATFGASATAAPGSMTPNAAGELITDFNLSNQSVLTPATGYTQRVKNTFGDDLEDIEGGTTSATNPSVTLSTSGNWVASNVAWKPQTGSTPTSFSVTVLGGGTGFGGVTSNSGTPNLNCPVPLVPSGACSSLVSSGSTDTLTAAASTGSVFVGWAGVTGCSTAAKCIIPNITSSANVTATFSLSGLLAYYVNSTTGSDSNTGLCAVAGTPVGCTGPFATWAKANAAASLGASGTTIHFAGTSGSPQTYLAAATANCGAVGTGTFCVTKGGTAVAQLVYQCDNGLFGAAGSPGNPGPCQLRSTTDVGNQQIVGTAGASYVTIQGFDVGGDVSHPATLEQSGIQMYAKDGTALFMNISYNYVHDLGVNVPHSVNTSVAGTGCAPQGLIAYDTGFPFTSGRNATDGTFIGNFLNNGGDITNVNCNQMHGLYIGAGPRMKVMNNIIGNVPASGIKMYIANCQSVVSNNLVFHTGWWGILVADAGDGVCAAQGVSPIGLSTVSNNELVNTGFNHACGAIAEATGSGQNLYPNNLFIVTLPGTLNPLFPVVNCSTTPIPSPSVVSGTNSTATLATTFVSYADNGTGNYQSPAGGQAVNTGSTQCQAGGVQSCTPLIDILGVFRPQGASIDRGPYEQ